MTSALIILLAQDGELRLSDPVSDYVPGVPNGDHITIAELLKMHSGLYNYTNAPELAATMDVDPHKALTPQAMLDIAFGRPPNFTPDATYEYSISNYALLDLVAKKAGGHPLAQQFRDRLCAPLGPAGTSLPADVQAAARSGKLQPVDHTHQNPSHATAAGGVISPANDLAIWIRSLVTGKVLNPTFQQQWLHSPQAEDPAAPDGKKYGYGIAYQRFGPTPRCTTTAVNSPASTPSSATTTRSTPASPSRPAPTSRCASGAEAIDDLAERPSLVTSNSHC
ncbi:serine hydrolase domain-containing protein [Nonomuraea sp. NPDC050451]|uniref:serine hydrolase domain-containing protein n=1 Tax=Nonomuraea sp. NPDC050451 TaxID=3364364 RepID=UPI0037ACFD76